MSLEWRDYAGTLMAEVITWGDKLGEEQRQADGRRTTVKYGCEAAIPRATGQELIIDV